MPRHRAARPSKPSCVPLHSSKRTRALPELAHVVHRHQVVLAAVSNSAGTNHPLDCIPVYHQSRPVMAHSAPPSQGCTPAWADSGARPGAVRAVPTAPAPQRPATMQDGPPFTIPVLEDPRYRCAGPAAESGATRHHAASALRRSKTIKLIAASAIPESQADFYLIFDTTARMNSSSRPPRCSMCAAARHYSAATVVDDVVQIRGRVTRA